MAVEFLDQLPQLCDRPHDEDSSRVFLQFECFLGDRDFSSEGQHVLFDDDRILQDDLLEFDGLKNSLWGHDVQALGVASYLLDFSSCIGEGFNGDELRMMCCHQGGIGIGLISISAHILLMKGTYLLVMDLPQDTAIAVGKQGVVDFQKGRYVYVGSALNGLEQRIQRHLREQKKVHWHIDYFLPYAEVVDVFYKEGTEREECEVARLFERTFPCIVGFGCSDCRCKSHLFQGPSQEIQRVIGSLDMRPYLLHTNP